MEPSEKATRDANQLAEKPPKKSEESRRTKTVD
jgi:hypothetical protein